MSKEQSIPIEVAAELTTPSSHDLVAVCVFQGEPELTNATGGVLRTVAALLADGEFKGEEESTLLVHAATEEGTRRLLLVGMGPHGNDNLSGMRRAAATAT